MNPYLMPVLRRLRSGRAIQLARICLVLVVVPSLLTACINRKVLGDKKDTAKQVTGQLTSASPPATGTSTESSQMVEGKSGVGGGNASADYTVWFTKMDGDRLTYVSQTKHVDQAATEEAAAIANALNILLAGPKGGPAGAGTSAGSSSQTPGTPASPSAPSAAPGAPSGNISTEIPAGTILTGVTESNGEINVNFSHDFKDGGGSDSFMARLEQVKRTVSPMAGNHPVYIQVEGERLTTSGDGLEVKQPINDVEVPGHNQTN